MESRAPLIVGIGGSTRSGKSTMAKRLCELVPNSILFHADNYWKKDQVFDAAVSEYNREMPQVLDYDTLILEITTTLKERSDLSMVIVEGFLLFCHLPLDQMFDKRIFLTISKRECYLRRQRTLICTTAYFSQILWPCYVKYNSAILSQAKDYAKILSAESEPGYLLEQARKWLIKGEEIESLEELHAKNLRDDTDLSRYYLYYDEIGSIPDDLSPFSLPDDEFESHIAKMRRREPQPHRTKLDQTTLRPPGSFIFIGAAGSVEALDISKLDAAPPVSAWRTDLLECAEDSTLSLIHGFPTSSLFVVSSYGWVWKLLSRTGKVVWKMRLLAADAHPDASAASLWLQSTCRLIVAFASGSVFCISPVDGHEQWRAVLGTSASAPKLQLLDQFILVAYGSTLSVLDLKTGKGINALNFQNLRISSLRVNQTDQLSNIIISMANGSCVSLSSEQILSHLAPSSADFSSTQTKGISFRDWNRHFVRFDDGIIREGAFEMPSPSLGSAPCSVIFVENLLIFSAERVLHALDTKLRRFCWEFPLAAAGRSFNLNSPFCVALERIS